VHVLLAEGLEGELCGRDLIGNEGLAA
jgi:hypothetical protein